MKWNKHKLLYLFSNKFHAVFDLMSILFTSWRRKTWAWQPMWLCTEQLTRVLRTQREWPSCDSHWQRQVSMCGLDSNPRPWRRAGPSPSDSRVAYLAIWSSFLAAQKIWVQNNIWSPREVHFTRAKTSDLENILNVQQLLNWKFNLQAWMNYKTVFKLKVH